MMAIQGHIWPKSRPAQNIEFPAPTILAFQIVRNVVRAAFNVRGAERKEGLNQRIIHHRSGTKQGRKQACVSHSDSKLIIR